MFSCNAGITPPSADMSSGQTKYGQGDRQGLIPQPSQHSFHNSNPVYPPSHPMEPPSHRLTGAVQDKLDALEKLQYQLTTQVSIQGARICHFCSKFVD